jgi:hypothetical protein
MRGPKFEHSQLYDYELNRAFYPGVALEGFLPKFANPVQLFRGRGRVAGQYFRPFQPPQVTFQPQVGLQGVGGVSAGYLVHQPLLDPASLDNTAGE